MWSGGGQIICSVLVGKLGWLQLANVPSDGQDRKPYTGAKVRWNDPRRHGRCRHRTTSTCRATVAGGVEKKQNVGKGSTLGCSSPQIRDEDAWFSTELADHMFTLNRYPLFSRRATVILVLGQTWAAKNHRRSTKWQQEIARILKFLLDLVLPREIYEYGLCCSTALAV